LPRRPERKILLIALGDLVLGAVFVGSRQFTALEHIIGALSALGGIKAWCEYWRARDRYRARRSRYRR
jgi:hypothetical protein